MARERKEIVVTSTYDIETENWDTPVLCGQYSKRHGYRETRSIAVLARWLREEPGYHWAHNGGKFDALAVLDVWRAEGRHVTGIFAGGRIIALKCGASVLCDSAALWPATLAEITSGQANSKDACPLPCICEDSCGGYCSIKRDMPEAHYNLLSGYLRMDCISLSDALGTLIEFADENDMDLTLTVGSSAFHTASRWLGIEPDKHTLKEHYFRRLAYYGGRVQTFFLGKTGPGFEYDVVSMYASLLKNLALPVGKPRAVSGAEAMREFSRGAAGIYTVNVTVPEQFIPPLPYRTKKRLWYPHGTFRATYTQIELENAIQKYGVKVDGFGDARVYAESRPMFGDFIDRVFAMRAAAGKKTPMGDFLKRWMNSVYGKTASKPEKERMLINPPTVKEGDIQRSDDVFLRRVEMVDTCAHPVWAAYITSQGRIMLGDKLHEGAGPNSALYCDTDGVAVRDRREIGLGNSIGEWEGDEFADRLQIAPKVYARFLTEPNSKGEMIESRAKGLRLDRGEIPIAGNSYKAARAIKGAKSFNAKRTAFFERSDTVRKLNVTSGDRWVAENGVTFPPRIEDCK